jgi:aminoglycoside phosphotransferase family enzyme
MQQQVVDALMYREAYEEEVGQIELIQTHISWVFLTENFVYKVKKAVNLGFLDFTTLDKRRFFCEKELELNKRLCGEMYLEVVPINKSQVIKVKGDGKTVEYALKMRRIPQERIMNNLLEANKVDTTLIDSMARIIAEFHSKAETNSRIGGFGSPTTIKTNWIENFEQTREYIGKTISQENFELVYAGIESFMNINKALFEKRVAEGRVRDCHGDMHSGNIFVTDRILIFDAIEFNERFRYSDVTADIAFLAMDLEFKERSDLSKFLIKRYIEYSGDEEVMKLISFYKCYRAYVRGKVSGFKLRDPGLSNLEKNTAAKEAEAYFKLASSYARAL